MTERRFILSGKSMPDLTAVMPKNLVVRVMGFFTEKFDAAVALLSKWTNV